MSMKILYESVKEHEAHTGFCFIRCFSDFFVVMMAKSKYLKKFSAIESSLTTKEHYKEYFDKTGGVYEILRYIELNSLLTIFLKENRNIVKIEWSRSGEVMKSYLQFVSFEKASLFIDYMKNNDLGNREVTAVDATSVSTIGYMIFYVAIVLAIFAPICYVLADGRSVLMAFVIFWGMDKIPIVFALVLGAIDFAGLTGNLLIAALIIITIVVKHINLLKKPPKIMILTNKSDYEELND